jgi:hypothetical protein
MGIADEHTALMQGGMEGGGVPGRLPECMKSACIQQAGKASPCGHAVLYVGKRPAASTSSSHESLISLVSARGCALHEAMLQAAHAVPEVRS